MFQNVNVSVCNVIRNVSARMVVYLGNCHFYGGLYFKPYAEVDTQLAACSWPPVKTTACHSKQQTLNHA